MLPLPPGVQDDRAGHVANQLHSAAIRLLRGVRSADRESGLTPERLSVLSVLAFAGPKSVSELADAEMVSRPAISRIVNGLEDSGLARRSREREDRRMVTVHATAKGRRLMEKARGRRVGRIAERLAGLDASALRTLEEATRVLRSLD